MVEAEEKRRIGGRDGEVKGVTFWIPQRGNKKQQVRKKKNSVEGAWGGGGSHLHERQMLRLAVVFSRSWRDLPVKSLNQTCINY